MKEIFKNEVIKAKAQSLKTGPSVFEQFKAAPINVFSPADFIQEGDTIIVDTKEWEQTCFEQKFGDTTTYFFLAEVVSKDGIRSVKRVYPTSLYKTGLAYKDINTMEQNEDGTAKTIRSESEVAEFFRQYPINGQLIEALATMNKDIKVDSTIKFNGLRTDRSGNVKIAEQKVYNFIWLDKAA